MKRTMPGYKLHAIISYGIEARRLTRHYTRFKERLDAFLKEKHGYDRLQMMLATLGDLSKDYGNAEVTVEMEDLPDS